MQTIQKGFQVTVEGRKKKKKNQNNTNINRSTNIPTVITEKKLLSCTERHTILLYQGKLQDKTGKRRVRENNLVHQMSICTEQVMNKLYMQQTIYMD